MAPARSRVRRSPVHGAAPRLALLAALAGVGGCGGGGGPEAPGAPPATVTISVGDVVSAEGDAGATTFSFQVSIVGTPAPSVSVDWATADGTATVAGADYLPASGRLTFTAGGPAAQTVAVQVTGDAADEADEAFAVLLSGATGPGAALGDGQGQGTITNDDAGDGAGWPARVFAPYVDMGLWPVADLAPRARDAEAAGAVRMGRYVMAFLTAGGTKTQRACWAGQDAYEAGNPGPGMPDHGARISALRAQGGDVMVSFGGAVGTPIDVTITDTDALVAEYERVIAAYGLTHLDFDIEGPWVHHGSQAASIDRRSQAMRRLQDRAALAGRPLRLWLTLPVLPTGLTADGLAVVRSAVDAGVDLAGVNVMCMDYGAANYTGDAGDSAIRAGTALFSQLQALYAQAGVAKTPAQLWRMVGLTPMIGVNDTTEIVFTQADAREVLAFAQANGLGLLSMWSSHRDLGATGTQVGQVAPTHSGLDAAGTQTGGVTHTPHSAHEFSVLLSPFTD